MKKIAATAAILGALALSTKLFAVSIDITNFAAVQISDITTTTSEDGATTETRIEFSGAGLVPLMALLPKVSEFDQDVKEMRMFSISNGGQGVAPEKETVIYFECNTKRDPKVPDCDITIFKGPQPG